MLFYFLLHPLTIETSIISPIPKPKTNLQDSTNFCPISLIFLCKDFKPLSP